MAGSGGLRRGWGWLLGWWMFCAGIVAAQAGSTSRVAATPRIGVGAAASGPDAWLAVASPAQQREPGTTAGAAAGGRVVPLAPAALSPAPSAPRPRAATVPGRDDARSASKSRKSGSPAGWQPLAAGETGPAAGPIDADAAPAVGPEREPVPDLALRRLPELQFPTFIPEPTPPMPQLAVPPPPSNRHQVRVVPAAQARPAGLAPAVPLQDEVPPRAIDRNEREDERIFSSRLTTDSSVYGTWIDRQQALAHLERGWYYRQGFHYEMFTRQPEGDELRLLIDSAYGNDPRSWADGWELGHFSLESQTPKSRLVFGHSYPEISAMTCTGRIVGFYGEQRFANTVARGGAGFLANEKDDIKQPCRVGVLRLHHQHDESLEIGINASMLRDRDGTRVREFDTPHVDNTVLSLDLKVKANEHLTCEAEVANARTDLDRRDGDDARDAQAYRAVVTWTSEHLHALGGVEAAETAFYTGLGESPRDERAYFGSIDYRMNRYFATRVRTRLSRDNLEGGPRSTIVRSIPELMVRVNPSDVFPNLAGQLTWQPASERSDGGPAIDRNRTWTGFDLEQKAGDFDYRARLTNIIDRDRVAPINDRNVNGLELKCGWNYDADRAFFGRWSFENLEYRGTGGFDRLTVYGLGGRSKFHDDITVDLEFTRSLDDFTGGGVDSTHDRVELILTKEYNNEARFSLELAGADHQISTAGRSFSEASSKLRYVRFF